MNIISIINDAIVANPLQSILIIIGLPLLVVLIEGYISLKFNPVEEQMKKLIRQNKEEKSIVDKVLNVVAERFDKMGDKIQLDLEKSNVVFTKKEYLTILTVGMGAGALVGLIIFPFGSVFVGIYGFLNASIIEYILGRVTAIGIFGYAGMYVPKGWVIYKKSQRQKLIVDQIEDAFLIFADTLRSGTNIVDAFRNVGEELKYPLGSEFARAYQEMSAGKSFVKALDDLKLRVDSKDFDMAITAIQIQNETGAALEPLIREMVKIIGDRKVLRKEIQKIVADSQLTGYFLMFAPLAFCVFLYSTNKEGTMALFESGLGIIMVIIAVVAYILGTGIILKVMKSTSKLSN